MSDRIFTSADGRKYINNEPRLGTSQRKPLTDEEISKVAAPYYGTMGFRVEAFARAIERAHGIGDNT